MSTNTKYVGERSNISLHSCTFGPSPVYVDNHRYALVEVEKRGADKEATGCSTSQILCAGGISQLCQSYAYARFYVNLCSPGVSKCQQLCDFQSGLCSCMEGFNLSSDNYSCNPLPDMPTCLKNCGAGTCIKTDGKEECICPNATHIHTSKGCDDYCTNRGKSPEGMFPEDKCERDGDGFRCLCTGRYELDEGGFHCKRKVMCRDGGGNEICNKKNATCEELLSDNKVGYTCKCKQGYEKVGNDACISKCKSKKCEEKNAVCEFYGEYEPFCKCPLLMTLVNGKCSKLAENSYIGQLSILNRKYEMNLVSGRSKRSIGNINYPKLRLDIAESLQNVYDNYKDEKLLNCTEEDEILNCNIELQFEKKITKAELRKIADPSECIPLAETNYCLLKPNLIIEKIEKEEVFHVTDPCTPYVKNIVCGSMTSCEQVGSTNTFKCTCKEGFQKTATFKPTVSDKSLVDKCEDECLKKAICPNTTDCFNTYGSYKCLCKVGHKKGEKDTKIDGCIDVCNPSPCVHGTCKTFGDHGFSCSCDGDYTGVYCNVTNDAVVKAKKHGRIIAAVIGGVLGILVLVLLISGYLYIRKLKKSDEHEYIQPRERGALADMRLGKRQEPERDNDIELQESGRQPVGPSPERGDSFELRRDFGGRESVLPRVRTAQDDNEEEEYVLRPLPKRRDNSGVDKKVMIPRPRLTYSGEQYDEIHQTKDERPCRHFTKSSESLPEDDKRITSLQYKNRAFEND